MAFTGTILTTKGLALQAKVQAGTQLSFTKVKIGDGQLGSGQSLEALADLISPKKTLDISAVAVIGDGTSRVRAVVTNTGLAAGFFVREIGLFATDPDDGEILYCVANAGNECDYLPTPTSVAVEQTLDILTAIGNSTNVTAVINETIVLATIQDITDHNNNSESHGALINSHNNDANAHNGLLASNYWQSNTDYVVGDIVFCRTAASYKRVECVVEGTSGATEPTLTATGTMVTDNTVTWIVDDVRDGTPVGRPVFESVTSKAGYVKANGALLNRADYPRLWSKVQTELQVVTDADWAGSGYSGRYSSGNGATTFRVPDLRGEFIRGFDDSRGIDAARVLGSLQADTFKSHLHTYSLVHAINGFGNVGTGGQCGPYLNNTGETGGTETRPRNIAYLALIKY